MSEWVRTAGGPGITRRSLLCLTVATEGGLLIAALLLGWLFSEPFWQETRMSWRPVLEGLFSGLLLLAAAILFTESPLRFAAWLRRDIEQFAGIFDKATLPDLLLISLLAGAGEEALFRGVLQPAAAEYAGVRAAIAGVSILFGLMHYLSRAYMVFTACMSVCFGLLYARTGDILVPAIAHALYDFLALLYGVRFHRFTAAGRK